MSSLLRSLWLVAALFCAVAAAAELPSPQSGKLNVYFLDVGQGDAALVVTPTGKSILIDGGPPDTANATARKVASLVDGKLDLVVLSHPHLDHVGGLLPILARVGAKNFMDPGFDHPTRSYERVVSWVADHDVAYLEPEPPSDGGPFNLDVGGGSTLEVFWPRRPVEPFLRGTRSDANANSIVLKFTYGKTSFLFTGDAEADTEAKLLRSGFSLKATVLKVPHHGSRFSSQQPFVSRVSPSLAVVSCGAGNEYGHPHLKAVRRYDSVGAKLLRTDLVGDVVAVSDGVEVKVHTVKDRKLLVGTFSDGERSIARTEEPEPEEEPTVISASTVAGRFAASSRSKVFHRSDCPAVQKISPRNLMSFESRNSAASSRRPAKDCQP